MLIVFLIVLDYRCNNDATAMITNILYCVLSVIQGIALNTGNLPFSKGRVLHHHASISRRGFPGPTLCIGLRLVQHYLPVEGSSRSTSTDFRTCGPQAMSVLSKDS